MGVFAIGDATASLTTVVATGAGTAIDCRKNTGSTWVVVASGVTSGGTVKIQGSLDGTNNWYDVATISVTATGASVSTVDAPHPFLRANLTARTDGTYTVSVARWVNGR